MVEILRQAIEVEKMSSGFYRYAKIYRTQLIKSAYGSIVIDPVRVEVFTGTRVYGVLANPAPLVLATGI